jgi:hypothetical protein
MEEKIPVDGAKERNQVIGFLSFHFSTSEGLLAFFYDCFTLS